MGLPAFFNSETYTYVVIPLLIFFARIIDVSIGTVRLIFTARGYRSLAPILGFFEVLVWLLAIKQILSNLTNVMTYIGYAAGFATGTYVGIILEERLSIGNVMLRITARKNPRPLLEALKKTRHFVTDSVAHGPKGKVAIIHLTIPRQELTNIIQIIKHHDPKAIYTIEDVRSADQPIIKMPKDLQRVFFFFRKNGK